MRFTVFIPLSDEIRSPCRAKYISLVPKERISLKKPLPKGCFS